MSDTRQIFIIGQNRLQNDLICEHIVDRTGLPCHCLENLERLPQTVSHEAQVEQLILLDCQGVSRSDLLKLLEAIRTELVSTCLVAFFNLAADIEIENRALQFGVRGFFYETDSAASLIKGVDILFSGDYWVSRQKLIDNLVCGNRLKSDTSPEHSVRQILTSREIEILSRVAMGESNELIAEKFCISPHTVRTHIYNIFKKIKVPNRLQASLWAAKHF